MRLALCQLRSALGDKESNLRRMTETVQSTVADLFVFPESYVTDLQLRLGLYRRLSTLEAREDIDGFATELVDRFGPMPPEVKT